MATYETRNTNYQEAHGFTDEMLECFVKTFELKQKEKFLDLMGGSGTLIKKVIEIYGGTKETRTLLDAYSPQVQQYIQCKIRIEDARITEIPENSYDVVAMKSAIHEIRKHQQSQVYKNIHYFLKPNGRIYLWEIACKNSKSQEEFNNVIRKKDELAGFKDFTEKRHFCSLSEIITNLDKSGFRDIGIEKDMNFIINTKNWLNNDFGGNKKKVKELNKFIRKNYDFKDYGNYLTKEFYWPIISAKK